MADRRREAAFVAVGSVAGVAALYALASLIGNSPTGDPDPQAAQACMAHRAATAVIAGAVDIGTPGRDDQSGAGRLDVYRSLIAMRDQNANFNIDLSDALVTLASFGDEVREAPTNVNCDPGTDLADTQAVLQWFGLTAQ